MRNAPSAVLIVALAMSAPALAKNPSVGSKRTRSLGNRIAELKGYFTNIERRLAPAPRTVTGHEANVCLLDTAAAITVPMCGRPYPLAGLDLGVGAGIYHRNEAGGMRRHSVRVIGWAGAGANATSATLSRISYRLKDSTAAPPGRVRRLMKGLGKLFKIETRTLAGGALLVGYERSLSGRGSEIAPGSYKASSVTLGVGPQLAQQGRVVLEIPLPGRYRSKTRRVLDEALGLLNMEGLNTRARAERMPRLEALRRKMLRLERRLPGAD